MGHQLDQTILVAARLSGLLDQRHVGFLPIERGCFGGVCAFVGTWRLTIMTDLAMGCLGLSSFAWGTNRT